MSGHPTITVRQPWASLIALNIKRIETRSWKAPAALIGQHLRIHAGVHEPPFGLQLGPWTTCQTLIGGSWKWVVHDVDVRDSVTPLALGAIVATARLVDCVPMVGPGEGSPDGWPTEWPLVEVEPARLTLWPSDGAAAVEATDITDQLPYGDFAPGRWAWLLDDIKPTTERCPACLGEGQFCEDSMSVIGVPGGMCPVATCTTRGTAREAGNGKCPPVPAKGRLGVWRWQP